MDLAHFPVDKADFDGPVLVTGAGGCIGSWVLALLARAGVPAVAFDVSDNKRRPLLLLTEEELADVPWRMGDIADTDAVANTVAEHEVRAIIHLAALQVPFCKANPVGGAKANVVGTVNVLEAARHHGVKRVAYASSIAAHSFLPGTPWLATLYGAYAGQPYTIPFSGPVSALHAGEVASAFIKAVSQERTGAEVFDINGRVTSVEAWLDIVRALAPGAALTIEGETLPFPADLSDDPVQRHLGDYGPVPLEEGIEATYLDFRRLLASGALSPDAVP